MDTTTDTIAVHRQAGKLISATTLLHRSDPHADFDLASFGVVKVLDGQSAARGHA